MPSSPRVSIILPTHNRPTLLCDAVDSLRMQTFQDWEAIVVDDASNPPAMIETKDTRIRIIRHKSAQGGAAAKNTGIDNARGDILAFLDDDDCYAPKYIEDALNVLDQNSDVDVVFMGVTWFGIKAVQGQANYDQSMKKFMASAGGQTSGNLTLFDRSLIRALLKSVPMALQRPVVRKSALARIGRYRPECLLWDCDWAITAALNSTTCLLSKGLYMQRVDGQGYSSQHGRAIEHIKSSIEIMDRLFQKSLSGEHPQHLKLFRQAAADSWFTLAWHHYKHGNRSDAISALLQSARRQIRLSQLKLLTRLAIRYPAEIRDN